MSPCWPVLHYPFLSEVEGGIDLTTFGPIIDVVSTHGKGSEPCLGWSFEIKGWALSWPIIHITRLSLFYIWWPNLKHDLSLYSISTWVYERKFPSLYDLVIRNHFYLYVIKPSIKIIIVNIDIAIEMHVLC